MDMAWRQLYGSSSHFSNKYTNEFSGSAFAFTYSCEGRIGNEGRDLATHTRQPSYTSTSSVYILTITTVKLGPQIITEAKNLPLSLSGRHWPLVEISVPAYNS